MTKVGPRGSEVKHTRLHLSSEAPTSCCPHPPFNGVQVPSLLLNVDASARTVWRKVLTTALSDGLPMSQQVDDDSASESWESDYDISDYGYNDELAPNLLDHDEAGRGVGDEIGG